MARLACGLEDRPLPPAERPSGSRAATRLADPALVATDDRGQQLGAIWWHFRDPPLILDDQGDAIPELSMAVVEEARGRVTGRRMIEELAFEAADRVDALALNVHLRNPAIRLYMRSGFRVAGKGRGWYGVAMARTLR